MGQLGGLRRVAGRYRLIEVLGRGGMGTVWRAEDELLGRLVAVKAIAAPGGDESWPAGADPAAAVESDAQTAGRARREARAAGRLNHPGAVTVHDVIEENGRFHIIMELIDAPTLAELVRSEGQLAPARVAEIGTQLLDVLDFAHAEGIVHRDVKPSNVMVLSGGRVKLTDFGIAALRGDPQLTVSGTTLGSPMFMAPEQASGTVVGPAADLWSLGATMYYAVEGRAPFERQSAMAVLAAILSQPPDPPRLAGPLTPALTALLVRDPANRPDGVVLRRLLDLAARETVSGSTVSENAVSENAVSPDRASNSAVSFGQAGRGVVAPEDEGADDPDLTQDLEATADARDSSRTMTVKPVASQHSTLDDRAARTTPGAASPGAGPVTGAEPAFGTGSAFDTGPAFGAGPASNAGSVSDAGRGSNAGSAFNAGRDSNAERGLNAGPGFDAGRGSNAGRGFDTGRGPNASPGFEASPGFDAGPGFGAGSAFGGEPVMDQDVQDRPAGGKVISSEPVVERLPERRRDGRVLKGLVGVLTVAVAGLSFALLQQDQDSSNRTGTDNSSLQQGAGAEKVENPVKSDVAVVSGKLSPLAPDAPTEGLGLGSAGRDGRQVLEPKSTGPSGQTLAKFYDSVSNPVGGYAVGVPMAFEVTAVGPTLFVEWNDTMFQSEFEVRSYKSVDPWTRLTQDANQFAKDHAADKYRRTLFDRRWNYLGKPASVWEFTWYLNGRQMHAREVAFRVGTRTYTVLYRSAENWWLGGGTSSNPIDFERSFFPLP
jgi:serine/threonine protein kinase